MNILFQHLKSFCLSIGQRINRTFKIWTKPPNPSQLLGTLTDLNRSKVELVTENALLRQQLIALSHQSKLKRPEFSPLDRFLILLFASKVNAWKQALLILKPDTLLHWHRQGFRLFWKLKSKPKHTEPKINAEIGALIKQMAAENQTWGAERIRGELLKVGIKVSKRTIQKYMKEPGQPRRAS